MKRRVYDQWAGNPQGTPEDVERCVEDVADGTGWHWNQCARKRGYGLDGLYCRQHAKRHPVDRTEAP